MKIRFDKEKINRFSDENLGIRSALIVFGISLIILIVCLLGLLIKDKDYSERENRSLTMKPIISAHSIMDGDYMTDFDSYLQDQFPARDILVSLKTNIKRILGLRELNGVYLGKKGYLMEDAKAMDSVWFDKNLNAINDFATRHEGINIYMTVVPNAVSVMADYLPKGAPVLDQESQLADIKNGLNSNIDFIDVSESLKEHIAEGIYYHSDHHWTSLGAKYAFETIAPRMNLANLDSEYEIYHVSKNFRGTMSSKSGVQGKKDFVDIYVPTTNSVDYIVNNEDTHEESLSMYKSEMLETKDKYAVFFGGNYSKIDIKTTVENRRCLLIIKDSYANCFVQFLIPYFEHIIMIDPRYYYESLDSVLDGEIVTDVLFLYNLNTYLEDKSLANTLETE